jgi:hypothetical protein
MMSTHPRAAPLCAAMAGEDGVFREWRVYPLVPYVNKYVRGANEKGLVTVLRETLAQASLPQKVGLLLKGGRGLLARDVRQALRLLVDVELVPVARMPLGAIFLHDALTDLAVGIGVESVLEIFRDHVRGAYGVPAGFATKNLPLLRERLDRLGWTEALVMGSLNAAGFYVNPSLERCVDALARPGLDFVAMNTLAAGALSPDAAYRYLGRLPAVRSVVVGVSRPEHLAETVGAIRRHLPCAGGEPAPGPLTFRSSIQ